MKIDAVNDTEASNFYLGKKVAFIYKSKVAKAGSKFRGREEINYFKLSKEIPCIR
jgi:ribosomal protein L35AE/L33A